MVVSTKLAAAVMGGLLLAAVYTPAWAGSDTAATSAPQAAASDQSMVGVLSPLFANVATHPAQKGCKADTLYSNHDVVGDPDSCFQNKLDARAGSSAGGSAGAGVL